MQRLPGHSSPPHPPSQSDSLAKSLLTLTIDSQSCSICTHVGGVKVGRLRRWRRRRRQRRLYLLQKSLGVSRLEVMEVVVVVMKALKSSGLS
ncbi:hypothetical protein E2C01_038159 [Portunus trituberculatus]|uniref:Uncharacterized protein n=1 Tax=Portunus trituberculatus TaxID=210409 RepID=A0A5B7FGI3_PORTR|nr:hypothetical protein [Portunus trituberculatus]